MSKYINEYLDDKLYNTKRFLHVFKENSIKNTAESVDVLSEVLLDDSDYLSFYSAKNIVKRLNFEDIDYYSYIIFIVVNMASITYIMLKKSQIQLYLTTLSGLKKTFEMIYRNPLLIIFFLISLYFRILDDFDKNVINMIAETIGIPKYEYINLPGKIFTFTSFFIAFLNYFYNSLNIGNEIRIPYIIINLISNKLSLQISNIIKDIPNNFSKYFTKIVYEIPNLDDLSVNIKNKDLLTKTELLEWKNYALSLDYSDKDLLTKKELLELKNDSGEIICLDDCKYRSKTESGCYCEGECSKSFGGEYNWCYVDERKCPGMPKNLLPKYLGKSYDKCESNKKYKTCFTGYEYRGCK